MYKLEVGIVGKESEMHNIKLRANDIEDASSLSLTFRVCRMYHVFVFDSVSSRVASTARGIYVLEWLLDCFLCGLPASWELRR